MRADVVKPLYTLLTGQEEGYKQITKQMKHNEKQFGEKKALSEDAKNTYLRLSKEVDESISTYQASCEKKDFPEERKAKAAQRINQGLRDWKEAERSYKSLMYGAKEARIDYIRMLVCF